MPNAIETFRAQREAADAVHERLQEIAELLAHVRIQVDAVSENGDLRAVLQREEAWLSQASRTVNEVRAWREHEARQILPSIARRWVLALVFALVSAWIAGAGYAHAAKPYTDELTELRARLSFAESIERRVASMTPAERSQFNALMAPKR